MNLMHVENLLFEIANSLKRLADQGDKQLALLQRQVNTSERLVEQGDTTVSLLHRQAGVTIMAPEKDESNAL